MDIIKIENNNPAEIVDNLIPCKLYLFSPDIIELVKKELDNRGKCKYSSNHYGYFIMFSATWLN